MAISMYQSSAPQLKKMLVNLTTILTMAEEYATAKGIDGKVLVEARLFPDMFPLARQVQIACDQVKFGLARLAGVEAPKFEDTESTLPELKERIAKTITFMDSIKPEQIDGAEEKVIQFSIKGRNFEFVGEQYVLTWIIPNFYFHITTTYNILRHNGVELGKADYLG